MMDKVYFQVVGSNEVLSTYENGAYIKSYNVSPPEPKVHKIDIDGADGSIDITEWSGDVRYQDREIVVELRDMGNYYKTLIKKLNGRMCNIMFSDDIAHYYLGRCVRISTNTEKHVTDIEIGFLCSPWKLSKANTVISQAVSTNNISLRADRKPCIPKVVLTNACTLTWDGTSHEMTAGTTYPSWLIITDTAKTLGVSGSGTITIEWQNGVF